MSNWQPGPSGMYQPVFGANPYARIQPAPVQQPYYQQPQPVQTASLVMVTKKEEAVAAQIPFDDVPHFFANWGAGEVYAKVFNPNTCTSELLPFALIRPEQASPAPEYALLDDFRAMANRVEKLEQQLDDGSGYTPRRTGRRPVNDDAE